jgi:serine/alanine adding enzyme
MTSVRVVRQLEASRWTRFVDEHPRANIFHTPEMFAVFERTAGHRPDLWAATDDMDVLVLFTPVHITLGGAVLRSFTTRSVAYGGVLLDEAEPRIDVMEMLLADYAATVRRKSLFTELRNLHGLDGLKESLERGDFVFEDHLNYLIDLDRSISDIFDGIKSSARKELRRGWRRGEVTVAEVMQRSELVEWYELLRETYRRAHVPLPHRSLFEAAFDVLVPSDMIRFFVARVGSAAVACSAELLYKDTIYGWYGGSDRSYSSYMPNDLLTWHVLEWGANHGYRVYDFGGAGKPMEPYGVRAFKAKFGGELVDYGRNVCVHSDTRLALSKLAYRAFQAARLPLPHRRGAEDGADDVVSTKLAV